MPPSFQVQNELPKGYINKQNKRVSSISNNEKEKPIKLAFSIENSDRPLSDDEIGYENKAEKYNIDKYKRISPNFGTLAYLFRNVKGNNETVVGALRAALQERGAAGSGIKDIIIKYDSLDENSQKRIDVWDLICKDLRTSSTKVWNYFIKGIKLYVDAIKQTTIELNKPDLVETINKFGKKENNYKDRELAAKIGGLVDEAPLVNVTTNNDNRKTTNTVNLFGKEFTDTIREVNAQLTDKETKFISPLELTEGTTEYIEADYEMSNEEEKETIKNN